MDTEIKLYERGYKGGDTRNLLHIRFLKTHQEMELWVFHIPKKVVVHWSHNKEVQVCSGLSEGLVGTKQLKL